MENWKTHLISLGTLTVFLVLALASSPDNSLNYSCEDPYLKDSEPITSGNSSTTYQVRVLDQTTNQPIPSVSVVAIWKSYNCRPISACTEKCAMALGLSSIHEGVTNSAGIFSQTTPVWTAKDKKDRMIGEITLIDETDQHVPKRITVQISKDQTSASFTAHLLNINAL